MEHPASQTAGNWTPDELLTLLTTAIQNSGKPSCMTYNGECHGAPKNPAALDAYGIQGHAELQGGLMAFTAVLHGDSPGSICRLWANPEGQWLQGRRMGLTDDAAKHLFASTGILKEPERALFCIRQLQRFHRRYKKPLLDLDDVQTALRRTEKKNRKGQHPCMKALQDRFQP